MPDARAPRGRAAAPPPRAGPPVAPLLALLLAAALSPPAPVLAAPAVVCDVAFTELSFSFANTDTALAPGMGKRLGDRVLYRNVTARPCNGTLTSLDAVVTTKSMTDAFIRRYEVGAKAGGTDDYFQVRWAYYTHSMHVRGAPAGARGRGDCSRQHAAARRALPRARRSARAGTLFTLRRCRRAGNASSQGPSTPSFEFLLSSLLFPFGPICVCRGGGCMT